VKKVATLSFDLLRGSTELRRAALIGYCLIPSVTKKIYCRS
jgi:hypothetical protein